MTASLRPLCGIELHAGFRGPIPLERLDNRPRHEFAGSFDFETWEFAVLPSGRWLGICDHWDLCFEAATLEELHAVVNETIARMSGPCLERAVPA